MARPEPSNDVALVVGAGGPTGAPFIWSALDALTERTGWDPASATELIGTSAGAFVVARFTSQSPPDAVAVDALRSMANGKSFRATPAARTACVLRAFFGRLVARLAPMSRDPADYTVPEGPFHSGASAVTVRRSAGKRSQHVLHPSNAESVVRASAAIPFANRPVRIDGEAHVDGAAYSANNADLVNGAPAVVVIISPMIPAQGGSMVSRAHRAQLTCEIVGLVDRGCEVVAILPAESAHSVRRDRERFAPEGAAAVARL